MTFRVIQKNYTKKKLIYVLLFFGLITGNLWIYPKSISQGWDATLAHVPYHSLRIKAIDYLKGEQIDISNVASFFPNLTTVDFIDFSGDKKSFTKFTGTNKYVLSATVYNLSDEELNLLDKNYTILKEFRNLNITITIYTLDKK